MEEACSLVQTIIAGQSSNLTESLATRLPNVRVLSARAIVASEGSLLPKRPYRLVINSFQPASRLRDLSQPRAYVDQAIGATARLLEDVDPRHCLKVLYTSSASVYGDAVNCSEAMLVSARDLHSGLKVANEQLVRGVCAARGIDATIARLFNLYGGRDTFSVVAKIVDAVRSGSCLLIRNDGNAVRDFVHIDDVVRAYEVLLGVSDLPLVNVASGVGVSVRSLIDAVRGHGHELATESQLRDEIRVSTADVSLLSSILDVTNFRYVVDHVVDVLRFDRADSPS